MATVVRFTHNDGNTDFYDNEVKVLNLDTIQEEDIWQGKKEYFHMLYMGQPYKKITMQLITGQAGSSTDIFTRCDALWNQYDTDGQPEVMTCYYRYGIDTTTYPVFVQMKRDEYTKPYFEGRRKANATIQLTFYEAVHEGVSVLRKLIGV